MNLMYLYVNHANILHNIGKICFRITELRQYIRFEIAIHGFEFI